MSEHSNIYDPRQPFSDQLSHFSRMNKDAVENYFASNGPLARAYDVPNWVEKTPHGFELVRIDGEEVHRFGFYITITSKPVKDYEAGKSKAVASWNYAVTVPSTEEAKSYQLYSDDRLKYVFAAPGGYAAAIPPRMRQQYSQIPQLRWRTSDGEPIPLMPYVNLAFFMWLEEDGDESVATLKWLAENMEGWSDYYQA